MTAIKKLRAAEIDKAAPSDSERMQILGRLVGGVAHDFNNLLTGIMLYCDLLVPALAQEERLRHYVEEIRKASAGGGALIQQLLALARNQPGYCQPLQLNEVIAESRNLLSRLIGEDIELICRLAKDLPEVDLDPAQAQQIILNLVLNARDAMPQGGRIVVATRKVMGEAITSDNRHAAGRVELSIEDTGDGIDAETGNQLFHRFFTTKLPGHGNGLGLSIVGGIVGRSGGVIQVESEPGQGTRVRIHLPAAKEQISIVSPESQPLENRTGLPASHPPGTQISQPRRRKTA